MSATVSLLDTTERVNGPLNEFTGEITAENSYSQLQKSIRFGTKLRLIAPFPQLSPKLTFVCIT